MNFISVPETGSTNSYLAAISDGLPHGTVVTTRCQSAGRGQRGNHWESQPGMNVTMSILARPRAIDTSAPFVLSAATALGAAATVDALLPATAPPVTIKWPNDIYIGDRKVAGILIENTLDGHSISRSIIGIGLNVNQRRFTSDAPNPVSLVMAGASPLDLDAVSHALARNILEAIETADSPRMFDRTMTRYNSRLYRRGVPHPYREPGSGTFTATATGVDTMGRLDLLMADGTRRLYHFKEVAHVINPQ